jgi:hypothetical protein
MTHGDKKASSAKVSSKVSDPQSGAKAGVQAGKSGGKEGGGKAVKAASAPETGKGSKARQGGSKAGSKASPGASVPSPRGRTEADTVVSFANAAIGASFRRAVKKYPNAFRRLTD